MRNCVRSILLIGLFLCSNLMAIDVNTNIENSSFCFTANNGQYNDEVLFYSKASGGQQYITSEGITYLIPRETEESRLNRESILKNDNSSLLRCPPRHEYYAFKVTFENANQNAFTQGAEQLPWVNHYFKGRAESQWVTDVPNYERVKFENIYNGINLEYYGNNNQLEYDLIVSPNGNPNDIIMNFEGTDSLILSDDGTMEIHTPFGKIEQVIPLTYQEIGEEIIEINSSFVINSSESSNVVGFDVGDYDKNFPLVIDPLYRFSFLYGSANDIMGGVDMDSSGNVYVTGRTESTNFPATIGTHQGDFDVFAAKLNSAGGKLWVAYIGGSNEDKGRDVAVGPFDKVYLTGSTKSSDFPMAGGSVVDTYGGTGGLSAFVMYLSTAGDVVQYSTYLGGYVPHTDVIGIEDDEGAAGYAIEVDTAGYFYVAGGNNSLGFAGTAGAFDDAYYGFTTIPGPSVVYLSDAFVCKFTPVGSFTGGGFFTYLGGYGFDIATGIDIDDSGYIYVSGVTSAPTNDEEDSTFFPYVDGSFYIYNMLGRTSFVTKLLPDGSDLVYSVPLGGANYDNYGMGVAVDDNYCAYVAGYTGMFNPGPSIPFFTTAGAFDTTFNTSRDDDAFVYKVNQDGTDIIWSTLLGGEGDDRAYAIDIDEAGSPYITGVTYSDDFPKADPGGISLPYTAPPSNLFLTKLNSAGSNLDFSGKFGTQFEDHHFGPACVYDVQRVAFSGSYDAPVIPIQTDGYVYIFDVNDLYQPMVFNSINLAQSTLFPLKTDSVNQRILTITINTTGVLNALEVTEFSLSTNGSTDPFTDITNAKMFYIGPSTTFHTSKQFGSTASSPSGGFTISGTQNLCNGANRFMLTYDIPSSATLGDSIDAECLSITIDGIVNSPVPTSPPGGTVILNTTPSMLSGTGTIGPGGDFEHFKDAFDRIAQDGLSGHLILELLPGQYYGQIKPSWSFKDSDLKASGNLTIQTHGSPHSAELMYHSTDSMANFVIQAWGGIADTVFINDLIITAMGDEYASAIEFTEGASNFYIDNCIINGTTVPGGPGKHKALIKSWTWGGYNSNLRFTRNTFNDGVMGIFLEYGLDTIFIDSNTFNNQMLYSINMPDHHDIYIGRNTFINNQTSSGAYAIFVSNIYKTAIIEKNRISTGFSGGIMLNGFPVFPDTIRALISNNFVTLTSPTPVGGIRCTYSDKVDIFNNNVNITSTAPTSACLITNNCTNYQLANNVFVNSGGGYVHYDIPAKSGGSAKVNAPDWSDYNDLYATGPYLANYGGTYIADLAALQTLTGQEAHSLSVDPGFVSLTDLHTTSPLLVGAGIYLERVPDDIDGNPRDPSNPSMGGGIGSTTDIDDDSDIVIPKQFSLSQNYPNPFNPSTTIEFSLVKYSSVKVNVYNILGQNVVSLLDKELPSGSYRVRWDGTNSDGQAIASGIYFYRIEAGEYSETKKMTLLK